MRATIFRLGPRGHVDALEESVQGRRLIDRVGVRVAEPTACCAGDVPRPIGSKVFSALPGTRPRGDAAVGGRVGCAAPMDEAGAVRVLRG